MIFAERKTKTGYHYETEDVFGKLDIDSEKKLSKNSLDSIVLGVLQSKQPVGKIGDTISFTFKARSQWEEDEEITQISEKEVKETKTRLTKRLTNFIKNILWK